MKTFFAWGANSHGQLGIGYHSEMCIDPQKVDINDEFIANGNISIKSITAGGGHVFILDDSGRLFGCGWNNQGQLGIGEKTKDESRFRIIHSNCFDNKPIDSIACGWDCSAAICSDGSLYVWGSNSHNQLGMPKKTITFSTTPIRLKMPQNETVKGIAFNLQSACIWTTCGIIYLFGKLKHYNDIPNQKTIINHNGINYIMINAGDVESISAGQNHIVILDKDKKKVFGFGNNKYLQCETVYIKDAVVKYISSGWTHNAAVTEQGNVYLWGRNNYGQCGISLDQGSIVSHPKKLEIDEKVQHVFLGAEHGVALTESDKLLTWGWNEHGNCGNSSVENVFNPVVVSLPGKCLVAGSGSGFCYAFVDEEL